MKKLLAIGIFLLFVFSVNAQELAVINNGNHSLRLVQKEKQFALVYSDINEVEMTEKSFEFFDKQKLYDIILAGFNNEDHQVYIQANKDTIVKFSYRQLNGEWMVMIKQENMDTETKSISTFFSKSSIQELFGNP